MPYKLSLLDKSPVAPGLNASDALIATITYARRAEELGYHRFWLAEHHNVPVLASSAPEVLIAYILARTSKIRVGSGGVMLRHYSPYKVAENFNLLASLAPGRVDLGIGKAPGGFPAATKALQAYFDPSRKASFEAQIADLSKFLALPSGKTQPELLAQPTPPVPAEKFLLGASVESAELAARYGWQLVFAGHMNGDVVNLRETFATYRRLTGRAPLLALAALAAETTEAAKSRVNAFRIVKVFLPDGQSVNVTTEEQAAEFARQSGFDTFRTEEKTPDIIYGSSDDVRARLDALHREFGVEEFVIETPAVNALDRLASIELIAKQGVALAA